MRRCPFAEVASAYEQVVCQVHLGLVRGALEEVGVSVAADWLKPHLEPHLCVAHLLDRTKARVA
jgi:predicted ArsR family transcriptional regulator